MFSASSTRRLVAVLASCAALLVPALAQAKPLTLINGWQDTAFGTAHASVYKVNGIVRFQGGIATTGNSAQPFVLPAAFRPSATVYMAVDMCNATNGRLIITPDGTATVQPQGSFINAQCLTSLDGAWFAASSDSFTPLKLLNGWADTPFGTAHAAARKIGGIVHLEGAMVTSGTDAVPFVLPKKFRPATDVYVKVDLCNAANGRLYIAAGGSVAVEVENSFSDAQCFTSLDGVSFAQNAKGAAALALMNGWTGAPFNTANPAATVAKNVVHLEGAIQTSGTNSEPFILPEQFRPANYLYVPVDLCNATNGRLIIQPTGDVNIQAETDFSNAQCFTSLDGVSFHK